MNIDGISAKLGSIVRSEDAGEAVIEDEASTDVFTYTISVVEETK